MIPKYNGNLKSRLPLNTRAAVLRGKLAMNTAAANQDTLDFIASLSRNARNSWFTLLGLLLFCGVTLLRFEHIDFYGYDRSTQLPVIGLSIPTNAFFFMAPIVCAATYSYLHLYLIRLWDALGAAPAQIDGQPLGQLTPPWLVSDVFYVLRRIRRKDGCQIKRPLEGFSTLLNFTLVYLFGPAVMIILWFQSAVARDFTLTMVALSGLLVMLVSGWSSLSTLRRRSGRSQKRGREWGAWLLAVLLGVPLGFSTYWRTVDPAPFMTVTQERNIWDAERQQTLTETHILPRYKAEYSENVTSVTPKIIADPLPFWGVWTILAAIDLEGEDLTERPEHWLPFDKRLQAYQKQWCADQRFHSNKDVICHDLSWPQKRQLYQDYKIYQTALLSTLKKPDWHKIGRKKPDFRGANLRNTFLAGLNMQNARFAQSFLKDADLSGADVRRAEFHGAHVSSAKFHGADVNFAEFHGADVRLAKFHGADVILAEFHGADVNSAEFHGADVFTAEFHGADVSSAKFHGADVRLAKFHGADVRLAEFHGADVRRAALDQQQVENLFFDGSVENRDWLLRKHNIQRPCQWVDEVLTPDDFRAHLWGWKSYREQKALGNWPYEFDDYETPPQRCIDADRKARGE